MVRYSGSYGTLQWELRFSKSAEVDGFVGVAAKAHVHGPHPGERQMALIQPASTYDTNSGAIVGMAREVQWWEPGTPLHCKVVNTGRATAVVRSCNPIA